MAPEAFNPDKYAKNSDVKGPMWDIESSMPDLTGKVALVTGANSPVGIGFSTAHQLALHGATVYIGARDSAKAKSAIASMLDLSPSLSPCLLRPFIADLDDLRAVKAASEALLSSATRLDIIIHNAGLLARSLDFNADGISVSMNTNHLAPFVITTTLLPLLERTAASHPGVRVVMLTSYTHEAVPDGIRFASLADFNAKLGGTNDATSSYARYGLSKLANLLFAKKLNALFIAKGTDAIALAVHPGGVKTNGAIRYVGEHVEWLEGSMTPLDGAVTSLFAATSEVVWKERSVYGGAYLMPFGVVSEESANAKNAKLADELWKTSEVIVERVLNASK